MLYLSQDDKSRLRDAEYVFGIDRSGNVISVLREIHVSSRRSRSVYRNVTPDVKSILKDLKKNNKIY